MTLISLLVVVVLSLAFLYVASRLYPVYATFGKTMAVMREIQDTPDLPLDDARAFRDEIAKRLLAKGITDVAAKELKIRRTRQGFVVEIRYEKSVPLLASLGLIAKFDRSIHVPKKPPVQ
jgi:hypothetical protein